MITVKPVTGKKGLLEFIDIPQKLYQADPLYIPQLKFERLQHLSPKNPYFKQAEHQFFVAYKNDVSCGRISAQINELAQKDTQSRLGHFGFVDAIDDEVLHLLLTEAESWLQKRGVKKVSGPYSLSINDEAGLLVDGFDTSPFMMMNFAPSWLGSALENEGYKKAKDLIAFYMSVDKDMPKSALRLAQKALEFPGLKLRTLDRKHEKRDLDIVFDIFNEAWAQNWGFVPMTREEIRYGAENMKALIRPDFVQIAELEDQPIAMIVALPDLNEALKGLNGLLLPFGWARLLWRLKVTGLTRTRVLLMGVSPDYQNSFLGGALASLLIVELQKAMRKAKYKEAELSWILEDNASMIRLLEGTGGHPYKRYRIYEKSL